MGDQLDAAVLAAIAVADRTMRWCPCGQTGCVPLLMKEAGGWMECGHCGQEVDHAGVELS